MEHSPQVGDRIPVFEAQDQHGWLQTFESIRGPAGAVIVFVRSADW
jgi:peroxiredoxin